jgi:lipopolysaccharide transport system ATP-binding protein
LALAAGAYRLRAHALDPEGMRVYDTVERDFTVAGDSHQELGWCACRIAGIDSFLL